MLTKPTLIKCIAVASLLGMSSLAPAQPAAVQQALIKFKSASQELIKLQSRVKDEASAKAVQTKLDAATKRQRAAEVSLSEAMKTLDLKNYQDAKLMERAYAEIQTQNKAVADAQLKAFEDQSAAAEKAAAHQKQ